MSPEMQEVEPAAEEPAAEAPVSPPHNLDRIREMVENGIQAVEAGLQAGTSEFHKFAKDGAGVLDHHGFKAWRANHSEGCDPTELDELEAKAVVDPDVESDEARAARVAAEEAAAAPDPTPASEAAAPPADASGVSGAQSAEPAPGAAPPAAAETEAPAV